MKEQLLHKVEKQYGKRKKMLIMNLLKKLLLQIRLQSVKCTIKMVGVARPGIQLGSLAQEAFFFKTISHIHTISDASIAEYV